MAHISIDELRDCCGCTACVSKCIKRCITMECDSEGFYYPVIDEEKCVNCGACIKVCQQKKYDNVTALNAIEYYAAFANDNNIRKTSSSGGVFQLIAEKTIDNKGVVYGVQMSDDCYACEYVRISEKNALHRIRGSKYIQAYTNDVYNMVKKDLENNTSVLFSGTPCICNGLHLFLGGKYEHLTILDCICHGVPSQKIWSMYLKREERIVGSKAINVSFRSKVISWSYFSLSTLFGNNHSTFQSFKCNPYMQLMLDNISLRPSCYSCSAKGNNRYADITLGDFWGIDDIIPKLNTHGYGVSAVICNTKKGAQCFNDIKDRITFQIVRKEDITKYNSCLEESVIEPDQRHAFFYDIDTLDINEVIKKYVHVSNRTKAAVVLEKYGILNIIRKIRGGYRIVNPAYGLYITYK